MNNLILVLLPIPLLIMLYVFIFSRRGEVQRAKVSFGGGNDWITFIAVTLGAAVMSEAIIALGIHIPLIWWTVITVLLFIFLFIVVIRRTRMGKPIVKRMGDERVNVIYAKSSRNALFATYLTLFIHLLITDASTLDTMWLVIALASGLLVLIASTFFYYYRES